MSDTVTQTWLERMWEEHRAEYLAECRQYNMQADGKDFVLWLEENSLIPDADETEHYAN